MNTRPLPLAIGALGGAGSSVCERAEDDDDDDEPEPREEVDAKGPSSAPADTGKTPLIESVDAEYRSYTESRVLLPGVPKTPLIESTDEEYRSYTESRVLLPGVPKAPLIELADASYTESRVICPGVGADTTSGLSASSCVGKDGVSPSAF